AEARDGVGALVAESLGEPAPEHRLGDRRRASRAHDPCAFVPPLDRPEVGRGAAEDEPVETLRGLERERHPDHATERQPAERDALELERIEELDDVVGNRPDGDGTVRDRRAAVAGEVEANHLEVVRERRELRIPELPGRPERVCEHERRLPLGPLDPVCQLHLLSDRYSSSARSTKISAEPRYVAASRSASSSASERPTRSSSRSSSASERPDAATRAAASRTMS